MRFAATSTAGLVVVDVPGSGDYRQVGVRRRAQQGYSVGPENSPVVERFGGSPGRQAISLPGAKGKRRLPRESRGPSADPGGEEDMLPKNVQQQISEARGALAELDDSLEICWEHRRHVHPLTLADPVTIEEVQAAIWRLENKCPEWNGLPQRGKELWARIEQLLEFSPIVDPRVDWFRRPDVVEQYQKLRSAVSTFQRWLRELSRFAANSGTISEPSSHCDTDQDDGKREERPATPRESTGPHDLKQMPEPVAASMSGGSEVPWHSPDFRSVLWFGTRYSFTPMQAACVAVLWEYWESNQCEVAHGIVLNRANSNSDRLLDVFRSRGNKHEAWGTMIVPGATKGTFRLNAPATI
jgi:hypothetical protein